MRDSTLVSLVATLEEATGRSLVGPRPQARPVRILHVVTSPRAEGTPRLVLDWLGAAGHEQGVAFLTGEPPDLIEDFRRTGCWLRTTSAIVPGPRKFLAIIRAARGWVREFRPDVVIAWPTGFSHWIFLGARAAGSRAALLAHGGNPPARHWTGRYLHTWLCLWTTALCGGRLVTCSRYVQRLFAGIPFVPASRIGVAYNSLQVDAVAARASAARTARTDRNVFRALMVATLEEHKDHPTLLRAAQLLQRRGIALEIWLAGAGSRDLELKKLAAELGVGNVVKFLGARRDVPELLGQCDLFVLSTTPQEGFGIVLFEALAAGLPIIASDVPPVREVLEDGRRGELVAAGDPLALAEALARSVQARETCTGPAADERRNFAASFSIDRMIAAYFREARLEGRSP